MRTKLKWSKLPTKWIINKKLKLFSNKNLGVSIGALKVYYCLCLSTDFKNGKSKITYDDFENMTGLSRSMISKGISFLEENQLLKRIKSKGKQNNYYLSGYLEDSSWGKLPSTILRGYYLQKSPSKINFLYNMNLRNKINLNALKLYLCLATFRDRNTGYVNLSYNKISEYTGILRNDISFTLSLLYEFSLVQRILDVDNDANSILKPVNKYKLLGI